MPTIEITFVCICFLKKAPSFNYLRQINEGQLENTLHLFTSISGILGKILLSFSIYTNARKLLNVSQPSGTLTAVNGIRFISMTWVILGHTYYFGLGAACKNVSVGF